LVLAAAVLSAGGCAGSEQQRDVAPESRAVTIRTTACGDASKTVGSGVMVGDDVVLTAAHVVIGATDVAVQSAGAAESSGVVVALDTVTDLALVQVDAASPVSDVTLTDFVADERATLLGGASSGDVEVDVLRRVLINVDEVRGTSVVQRDGYEVQGAIEGGDSGAGIFDADGALGAMVFAEPSRTSGSRAGPTDRLFATSSSAIRTLIERSDRRAHVCDPGSSRLVVSMS